MLRQDKRNLRVKEEATDQQSLGNAKGERTSQKCVTCYDQTLVQ